MKISTVIVIAISAALISVLSPLAIPLGIVPFTLQTFVIGLMAVILRPRESFLAVLIYLLLGLIGLPVFAGGASGGGVLFGPNGGFLIAFLIIAPLISSLVGLVGHKWLPSLIICLICYLLTLLIGTTWLMFEAHLDFVKAASLAFLPFVILELIKAIAANFIGLSLWRLLSRQSSYFK